MDDQLLTLIFKVVTTSRILESGAVPRLSNNQRINMVFVSRFRRLSKKCCSISEYWLDTISNWLFLKFINIRKFKNLRHLTCTNKITDEDLAFLPHLITLNARDNEEITDAGIKGLPLQILDASRNPNITNAGIEKLPLRVLITPGNYNITDEGVKNLLFLHTLSAESNSNITNAGIKDLPLHTLNAGCNENITDEGIKDLRLHTLHARRNKNITREGAKHIPNVFI